MNSEDLREHLERHHAESYGWARCCCRQDPDEAENVLQAAYLKIFESKAVFDGRSAFRTWLFAVIRNTAAEKRRTRFLEKLRLIRYQQTQTRLAEPARSEDSIHNEQVEMNLRRALATLPARQAEVLQLVFYHDLSLAEAAKVMGVSLGSARTHYARGKARLQRSPMSFDPGDEDLREQFQRLRLQDEGRAPAFRRPIQPAGHRRLNHRFVTVALILIIAGIAFVVLRRQRRPDETVIAQLSRWRSPTESLLRTPGRELLQPLPRFGGLIKEMK